MRHAVDGRPLTWMVSGSPQIAEIPNSRRISKTLPPLRKRGVEWLPAITSAGMSASRSFAKPLSASTIARGEGRDESNKSPA